MSTPAPKRARRLATRAFVILAGAAIFVTAVDWHYTASKLQRRADGLATTASHSILHGERPKLPNIPGASLQRVPRESRYSANPTAIQAAIRASWRPLLLQPFGVEVPLRAQSEAAALSDGSASAVWLLRLE